MSNSFEGRLFGIPKDNKSIVQVISGNGDGSTNGGIRIFLTVVKNEGSAIKYATDAALGDSFTIQERGVYSIVYTESGSTSRGFTYAGISLNSKNLTTAISSIPASEVLSMGLAIESGGTPFTSTACFIGKLEVGDIVRGHSTGSSDSTGPQIMFRIEQLFRL